MTKYMYPLFESIKVVDGEFINLEFHQQRVDRSRKELLDDHSRLVLADMLQVPQQFNQGIVKCRMSYGRTLGPVDFSSYQRRNISSLRLIRCAGFDYHLKYEDRREIDQIFQLRDSCDEVLIACDGYVTDTSYSNVVLFDGVEWVTPTNPLLKGTQRAKLIASGMVKEKDILVSDLEKYKKMVLINAMLEFDPTHSISIDNIEW